MLNFRKLRQDFSSTILKEGRDIYDEGRVTAAKLVHLDGKILRINGKIAGQYDNHYETELEIDRSECETIDSNCDCPYNYDCQHLAAMLFYLEQHLDRILIEFSKETRLEELSEGGQLGVEEHAELIEKLKEAETKEVQRQEELYQKQVLQEYSTSQQILAGCPFFRPEEKRETDRAELAFLFQCPPLSSDSEIRGVVEFQIALRLPGRSKPLYVPNLKEFFECLRYGEVLSLGGKRYLFSVHSFGTHHRGMLETLMDQARVAEVGAPEKNLRIGQLNQTLFGMVLARLQQIASSTLQKGPFVAGEDELPVLPGVYEGGLENPLRFSPIPASLRFQIEHIPAPASKLLITPQILLDRAVLSTEEVRLFECAQPGLLHGGHYYSFSPSITRHHLRSLRSIRDMTIPEPLFGTFVENALPELSRFAEVTNLACIEKFVTMPYVGELRATCNLSFLDGELEASLSFQYGEQSIPTHLKHLTYQHLTSFITKQGIVARNLVEERRILDDLFQDFLFDSDQGLYITKSDKKIVEFMTDLVPRYQHRVQFHCPQNLLDQFVYDQTVFRLRLTHTDRVDLYEIRLEVEGALKGVKLELLWECLGARRAFIELDAAKGRARRAPEPGKLPKILVLDLERLGSVIQLFDEMGIQVLEDHQITRPLWSLASIEASSFDGLPVEVVISERLLEIRAQMLGERQLALSEIPSEVCARLRPYQVEGVHWLERLRLMFLGGILADDMGLGKTLQAITAITQNRLQHPGTSLIVCPTSLLYNWKEECAKFNPALRVVVVDGVPTQRRKWIEAVDEYDLLITSYTLLQKDIDLYQQARFSYTVLDEAQHIKNRGTRNARSVKMVPSEHRLILSGTPIENSLDELWSLFDFLMPAFLGSYDRFVEKYLRVSGKEQTKNLEYLRRKVGPFILRRMKSDVLSDLPPVSELVYHCQLSQIQQELYRSYAESARDELVKLVQRDGFDRVQIHVLATLTRLKQICCHPAIFAKDRAEPGDSAKYDMLQDLLQTLIEGGHKTVIFSQYTRMLQIMREDFEQRGIRFAYLDGSSKNRLEVVRQFNEDPALSVFLVSLKAGGTGLNLVGADTVIHYDMWWNPAVESQATDRVHRLGQKQSVSSYKLITLGTIEEKIAEMQKRKKGLVKKVVSCDDEAITKLTWEDVLELLKT